MQILLDHITATMIGGTVLLILAVSQFRTSEAVVDQTSYYASKRQILEMTEMIEFDFKNIGLGVPAGTPVFNEVSENAVEFLMLLDPDDTALSVVRYVTVPTDTLELDGKEVPVYEVQRIVNGTVSGRSPARMSEFVIELRNVEGDPVGDPEDAETIHVRFSLIPPFSADKGFIKESHWARTFSAPNL
ncbi:hypothetical protein [Rhodocaloribacter sp.]